MTRTYTRNRIYLKKVKIASAKKTANGKRSSLARKKDPNFVFRVVRFNPSWNTEVNQWNKEKVKDKEDYKDFINSIKGTGVTQQQWETHAANAKNTVDLRTFLKLGIITKDKIMKTEEIRTYNHNTDQALAQRVASKPTSPIQGYNTIIMIPTFNQNSNR